MQQLRISKIATDEKQPKIKFNRKNAKEKLRSILLDDKLEMPKKIIEEDSEIKGDISFNNFDFNYFVGGPLVLESMNFNIRSGEKIGIGMFTFHNDFKICFENRVEVSFKSWTNWRWKK